MLSISSVFCLSSLFAKEITGTVLLVHTESSGPTEPSLPIHPAPQIPPCYRHMLTPDPGTNPGTVSWATQRQFSIGKFAVEINRGQPTAMGRPS